MRRRSLLAAAVAAPVVMGPLMTGLGLDRARAATGGAARVRPTLTLYDARLPVAERAAFHLHRQGAPARPTGGEIAALLLRERLFAAEGPVLGLTGHAEYLLAGDIARMAGRHVTPLMRLGPDARWLADARHDGWRPLLAGLLEEPAAGGTAFAWIAA